MNGLVQNAPHKVLSSLSIQVHQMNFQKKYKKAKRHSEYVLCFNILGIVLHVAMMLAAIVTAVVLVLVVF